MHRLFRIFICYFVFGVGVWLTGTYIIVPSVGKGVGSAVGVNVGVVNFVGRGVLVGLGVGVGVNVGVGGTVGVGV